MGAKKIVFTCPSCYHMWKNFYEAEVELLCTSALLEQLISEKRIHLKEINATVTYHDLAIWAGTVGFLNHRGRFLRPSRGLV